MRQENDRAPWARKMDRPIQTSRPLCERGDCLNHRLVLVGDRWLCYDCALYGEREGHW